MIRRGRLHVPGGRYHVMLRGNNRGELFDSMADRIHLNQLVGSATTDLGVRIHAFCWMPNHLHMAIQVAEVPLGRLMQGIASRYAFYLNRRRGSTGHVFERRFRAVLVNTDARVLQLVRYIHRNPVEAGLVDNPLRYPWCSHRYYMAGGAPDWLETDWVMDQFGPDRRLARAAFRHFVADDNIGSAPEELLTGCTDDDRIIGGNTLLDELDARGIAQCRDQRNRSRRGDRRQPAANIERVVSGIRFGMPQSRRCLRSGKVSI